MNIITIEILEEDYLKIPKEIRDRINIKVIEPKNFDYSISEEWNLLKKESSKAYKKLKDLEFKIRHE